MHQEPLEQDGVDKLFQLLDIIPFIELDKVLIGMIDADALRKETICLTAPDSINKAEPGS